MNLNKLTRVSRILAPLTVVWLLFCTLPVLAQRDYTVIRPRERSSTDTERVVIRNVPLQPTKGILAVVLNYDVKAEVVIKNAKNGRIVTRAAATDYQAEFELQRGLAYEVEVAHPGYVGGSRKTRALGATEIVRINLTPQFATLRFRDLPQNAQVFLDNELRATADKSGSVVLADIKPGDHDLLVRHPQYEDYYDKLTKLEAGVEYPFLPLRLSSLARIAIQGPPGTRVLIDGDMRGRIKPDGTVRITYELETPGEHTISFELLGYETLTKREMLKPGVSTMEVKLDPIITSVGFSDFFENLSQWTAPPTWKIVSDQRNKKLEVRGDQLGLLTGKVYRDLVINFTLWLNDGRGATWVVRADKEGRRYYLFHLSGPNSTGYTPRRFYTFLISEGKPPVEVSTPIPVIPELNTRTSYTINIVIRGNTIKHTISSNDTGVTDDLGIWTDTSSEKENFLYGTFGFRALSGEVFTVDDLALSLELPQ